MILDISQSELSEHGPPPLLLSSFLLLVMSADSRIRSVNRRGLKYAAGAQSRRKLIDGNVLSDQVNLTPDVDRVDEIPIPLREQIRVIH